MQTEQGEAEAKFWTTPELIEKLFSNLNLESTLSLARLMNKEILKRGMTSKVWDSLVRESFDLKGYNPAEHYDHKSPIS